MDCEETRDLLLTDHLDERTAKETRQQVQKHLETCPACHRFYDELQKVLKPFKISAQTHAPEEIWLNIRKEIFNNSGVDTRSKMPFTWAPALTLICVLTAFLFLFDKKSERVNQAALEEFFDSEIFEENFDLGTGIEEYFL